MQTSTFQCEDQNFRYTDREMIFPAYATKRLGEIIDRWRSVFPYEPTLIQRECSVPSLFVRFDCVITESGDVLYYELQDGPAWVGYTGIANGAFRELRDSIVARDWPGLRLVRDDRRSDKDDEIWLKRIRLREAYELSCPLLVRNMINLEMAHLDPLIARSVRPVLMHNNKKYGVELGWWRTVTWEESALGDALPWDTSFVLKPESEAGSTDIMLWRSDDRRGRATQTQIKRVLETRGRMYLQSFIEPMSVELDGEAYNFIYRPYFIYSKEDGRYIPAHGVWTARPYPNLRIHGASDSISGPLVMEERGH